MVIGDALFRLAQDLSDEPFELLSPVLDAGRVVDFVWRYLNPAAAALFGGGGSNLVGRTVGELQDEFHSARCEHWVGVMNGGGTVRADFARMGPDGLRWYRTRSTSLGEFLAVSSQDTTDEIRALEDERDARERVLRAARTRDEFLVKLNHELRTPLNAISGWAHLVGRRDADPAMVQRAAETIGRNVRAQAAIVDNLLAMNGIAEGSLGFERKYCDVGRALADAIEARESASEARWIEVHRERISAGLGCLGDEGRLRQIFVGLLDNAIRHTPLNGSIEVAAWRDDGRVRIEIRDTGDGIAPEKLRIVFEMFEQGNATGSRSHGGLGLGLAIVRSLVELHGGEVSLHSEGAGRGTTASVTLPYAERPEETQDEEPGSGRDTGAGLALAEGSTPVDASSIKAAGQQPDALPLAWRRVLVLEDQADSRELIAMLLSQQGAIVRAFDSAEHALAAAEHGSFDLVVSDLGMPGMDGLEFMQRLSRRPQPFKAIALTGYADEKYRAQALGAGFTRVVVKPIAPAEFLSVVLAELEPTG
jgi:signal transduction histidine kinase/CheY-like chemotaxis protein